MKAFRYLSLVPFLALAACGDNAGPPGNGSSSGGSSSSSSGSVPQDGGADVIPAASISLAIADATVIQGGTVDLTLELTRGASVTGDVTVKFATLPLGLGLPVGDLVFKAGQSTLKVQLSAGIDGKQGDAKLSATATTTDGTASSKKDFTVLVRGAPGTLDKTFGVDGVVLLGFEGATIDLASADSGDIFVGGISAAGGTPRPFVAKVSASGVPDTTFGTAGVQIVAATTTQVDAIALGPDGRVYAAMRPSSGPATSVALARLSSTGAVDGAFSASPGNAGNGTAFSDRQRLFVTAQHVYWRVEGSSIASLFSRVELLSLAGAQERVLAGGGGTGDMVLSPTGSAVACGGPTTVASPQTIFVTRTTAGGAPDGTFAGTGSGRCSRLAALGAGAVALAGTQLGNNVAMRLKSDLTLDAAFGNAGQIALPFLPARLFGDATDRLVFVAVDGGQYVVRRHLANGSVDSGFGTSGEARFGNLVEGAVAAAVQKNNRVIIGGLFPSGGSVAPGIVRFWD